MFKKAILSAGGKYESEVADEDLSEAIRAFIKRTQLTSWQLDHDPTAWSFPETARASCHGAQSSKGVVTDSARFRVELARVGYRESHR
jgi:hypothetical protein